MELENYSNLKIQVLGKEPIHIQSTSQLEKMQIKLKQGYFQMSHKQLKLQVSLPINV